jgi:hypothetical protein
MKSAINTKSTIVSIIAIAGYMNLLSSKAILTGMTN